MKPANVTENLPDDVAQCHALIQEFSATLHEERRLRMQLEQRVEQLLRRLYGPRAERVDPAQLILFGQELAVPQPGEAESPAEQEAPASAAMMKKGHGRKPLPKDLPRKRIVHDVPAEEKVCAECGRDKKRIGEEVSEQIEYVPASLCILEHVRPKYACPCCQEHVAVADKPPRSSRKVFRARAWRPTCSRASIAIIYRCTGRSSCWRATASSCPEKHCAAGC